MPLWNTGGDRFTLIPGEPKTVFDGEVLSDNDESISVALPGSSGTRGGLDIMWQVTFASAPTTVDYRLQVAMTDEDAQYFDTGPSMTATAGGAVTIGDVVANFARIKAVDADVQAATAKIMVR